MATIPTILYYWAIFLMVEFDAKKFGAKAIAIRQYLFSVAVDSPLRVSLHFIDRHCRHHVVGKTGSSPEESSYIVSGNKQRNVERCCHKRLEVLRPMDADISRIGIYALAAGMDGWMFKRATWYERVVLVLAGVALVYPSTTFDVIGLGLVGIAVLCQKVIKEG